jgi:hypothetical protein
MRAGGGCALFPAVCCLLYGIYVGVLCLGVGVSSPRLGGACFGVGARGVLSWELGAVWMWRAVGGGVRAGGRGRRWLTF